VTDATTKAEFEEKKPVGAFYIGVGMQEHVAKVDFVA